MRKGRNYYQAINMEIKEHRSSFIVFTILRASIIAIIIHQIYTGQYENVYLCVLTLLLLFVPSIVQVQFKIEIPPTLEIIIFCFIYAAEILGTLNSFYNIIPFWDSILHTLNGFLAAAIGFSLIWLLNDSENQKVELSPLYLCMVAFCFSMTIGVIWEFLEYGMDTLFAMDHQRDTLVHVINSRLLDPEVFGAGKSVSGIHEVVIDGQPMGLDGYLDIGLIDTMKDMFVNFIGALVFSIFGYFYAGYRNNNTIERFIPKRKDSDKDYLNPENRIKSIS
jgi:hypothetical protein